MDSNSFIIVNKDLLRIRCENTVKRINKYQKNIDDNNIDYEIKKAKKASWFGLCKGVDITREDAIKKLECSDMFGWRCRSGNYHKRVAKEILELCDCSEETVLLSSEHNLSLNAFIEIKLDDDNDTP